MHQLVFGINFQIHFVNVINPVSINLLIHLSTHACRHRHSQHPSLLQFFTRGSKNLPFQRILPTVTFLLYSLDCLHDNGTRPDLITLISLFFSFSFTFLCVPCGRLSWLSVSFLLHLNYTVSYEEIVGRCYFRYCT